MLSEETKEVLIDTHIHSEHSFDSSEKIVNICEKAIEYGLSYITITDHCDIRLKYDPDLKKRIVKSYKDTLKAKNKFSDKITVFTGLELGQPLENKSLAEEIVRSYNFDFTLLSLHNLPFESDFYYMNDFDEDIVNDTLEKYFKELAHTIREFNSFDSLAHLTYPLRYVYLRSDTKPDLNSFSNLIDDILNLLIVNNKALEINISGLTNGMHCTMPGEDILKRFKKLGGKYVTIGSDSHRAEKIGLAIKEGLELIKNCGFDSITVFEKHKPKLINI